ncbi:MAG: hypothetical protein JWL70_1025 [Acidimicrobiia bacterium]|nr:hypothetical protein [Acidimicrobiia bacterium]
MGYVRQLAARIEDMAFLDPVFDRASAVVQRAIPAGPVKDALSGRALDHPLHPVLTDIPIGAWTNSMLLDFVGGRRARRASQLLVGFGVLAAVPTAVSGWSDGADTDGRVTRLVTVHAVGNSVATVLYAASWAARRRGHHAKGVGLGVLGAAAATVGATLGGEIVFTKGIGVNYTAFDAVPDQWTTPEPEVAIPADGAVVARVAGVDVMVSRDNAGTLVALDDRCTHRGGPLHEGSNDGECVTCPWHGSRFRLADGEVMAGPAVVAQPVYDIRLHDDDLELRALQPNQ